MAIRPHYTNLRAAVHRIARLRMPRLKFITGSYSLPIYREREKQYMEKGGKILSKLF